MYNRYIPNGATYTRVVEQDFEPDRPTPPPSHQRAHQEDSGRQNASCHQGGKQQGTYQPHTHQAKPSDPISSLFSGFTGGKKNAGLTGILEKFKLDDIDTGDILLILILLFLFRDGDDIELVITLGLLLLLGLSDKEKGEDSPHETPEL